MLGNWETPGTVTKNCLLRDANTQNLEVQAALLPKLNCSSKREIRNSNIKGRVIRDSKQENAKTKKKQQHMTKDTKNNMDTMLT